MYNELKYKQKIKKRKRRKKLILSPSLDRTLHGNTRLNLRLSIYIKTLLSFYFKLSYHFFVPFAKEKDPFECAYMCACAHTCAHYTHICVKF